MTAGIHLELDRMAWLYAFTVIIVITVTMWLVLTQQKCPEQEICEFNLCKTQGSMEVCFGLPTNCTVLETKCTHEEYLEQWNLSCTWDNTTCKCLPSKDDTKK